MTEPNAGAEVLMEKRIVNSPNDGEADDLERNSKSVMHFGPRMLGVLSLIFVSTPSLGATKSSPPLARAPHVEQRELEARALAQGVPTLAEWLERTRPLESSSTKLQEALRKAQHAWLNDSIASARDYFRHITLQTLEDDWGDSERSAILFAHLRLAQTAENETEKQDWLDRAARNFHDLSPNASLFPPPLLTDFAKVKERTARDSIEISLDAIFPLHRFVLINGKRFDLNSKKNLRLPLGDIRVTAFSDSVAPTSEKMTTSQFAAYRPSLAPLFSGTCAQPLIAKNHSLEIDELHVLYENSCIQRRSANEWNTLSPSQSKSAAHSFGLQNTSPTIGSNLSNPMGPHEFAPEIRSPRRTWFWMAAASLAAGSAYLWHQRVSKESERASIQPVQRTGF